MRLHRSKAPFFENYVVYWCPKFPLESICHLYLFIFFHFFGFLNSFLFGFLWCCICLWWSFVVIMIPLSEPSPSPLTPDTSASPLVAVSPSQLMLGIPITKKHHPYHLTLIPVVGLAITAVAVLILVVLVFLIRSKNRELEDSKIIDKTFSKSFPPPWPMRKFPEGMHWILYCHVLSDISI